MRSVFQKTVHFLGATKANTPKPNTVSHDEKYMHTKSIPLSLRLLECLQNYNTSNSSNSNTLTEWPLNLILQKLAMRQHSTVFCAVRTHIENQHVDSGYSATDWEPQNAETDVSYV